jgi:hypothetical protein
MKQLKELIEASILGDIDTNINDVDKYLNGEELEPQLTDIKKQILKTSEWESWNRAGGGGKKYVTYVSVKDILEFLGINKWTSLKIAVAKFSKIETWTVSILLRDFPSTEPLFTIELPATKYSTFKNVCKKYLCEEVFKDVKTFSKFIKDNYNK